jgi:hypothetical protein
LLTEEGGESHHVGMDNPVFKDLNDAALLSLASSLRPHWVTCKFKESFNELLGTYDRVVIKTGGTFLLLLEFSDNPTRWRVRIPSTINHWDDIDHKLIEMWHINPLKFIEYALPHFPAPRIHTYEISAKKSIGRCFHDLGLD